MHYSWVKLVSSIGVTGSVYRTHMHGTDKYFALGNNTILKNHFPFGKPISLSVMSPNKYTQQLPSAPALVVCILISAVATSKKLVKLVLPISVYIYI